LPRTSTMAIGTTTGMAMTTSPPPLSSGPPWA
jgi:hypothetical protein